MPTYDVRLGGMETSYVEFDLLVEAESPEAAKAKVKEQGHGPFERSEDKVCSPESFEPTKIAHVAQWKTDADGEYAELVEDSEEDLEPSRSRDPIQEIRDQLGAIPSTKRSVDADRTLALADIALSLTQMRVTLDVVVECLQAIRTYR